MSKGVADIVNLIENYTDSAGTYNDRTGGLNILKQWYVALGSRELPALRELMTEDIVIEIPFNESGKTDQDSYRIFRGKEAVSNFWATAFKAEGESEGLTETELTVSADGSRIFLEARGNTTMKSGKSYRNRYVVRFDIKDNKLKHIKEYYNPIQSAYAFGRPIAGKIMIDSL